MALVVVGSFVNRISSYVATVGVQQLTQLECIFRLRSNCSIRLPGRFVAHYK